jgi:hypothetical protein
VLCLTAHTSDCAPSDGGYTTAKERKNSALKQGERCSSHGTVLTDVVFIRKQVSEGDDKERRAEQQRQHEEDGGQERDVHPGVGREETRPRRGRERRGKLVVLLDGFERHRRLAVDRAGHLGGKEGSVFLWTVEQHDVGIPELEVLYPLTFSLFVQNDKQRSSLRALEENGLLFLPVLCPWAW